MDDNGHTTVSDVIRNLTMELAANGDHPVAAYVINRSLINDDDVKMINAFVTSQLQLAHERTCPAPTHGGCTVFYSERGVHYGDRFDTNPKGF